MITDAATEREIRAGTVVRVYSPAGFYWSENFMSAEAVYFNEGDLIFTACHFDRDAHKGDYFSEFDEPTLEELRLAAALILPIGYIRGILPIYPLKLSLGIPDFVDLSDEILISQISTLLRTYLKTKLRINENYHSSEGPLPPAFGGAKYEYRTQAAPTKLQHRVLQSVDPADHLLMRGISAFVRAGMLTRHHALFEAAHSTLHIALDASFELILRKLRLAGVPNPTAADASAHLEKAFGEHLSGEQYFADYYKDRVRTMHPASRFGTDPYLPLSHSDFYGLYYGLREVYRWLILDVHVDLGAQ